MLPHVVALTLAVMLPLGPVKVPQEGRLEARRAQGTLLDMAVDEPWVVNLFPVRGVRSIGTPVIDQASDIQRVDGVFGHQLH